MKTIKYYSTVGLMAHHRNLKTSKLIRVCFDLKEDDSVLVYAVSGHNLSQIKKIPHLTITREELCELDDDPYDDLVFARAAFELLGLEGV